MTYSGWKSWCFVQLRIPNRDDLIRLEELVICSTLLLLTEMVISVYEVAVLFCLSTSTELCIPVDEVFCSIYDLYRDVLLKMELMTTVQTLGKI